MYLADAHCDTLTGAMASGEGLYGFGGHLSLQKLTASFDGCIQFMAVWFRSQEGMPALAHGALDYFDAQRRKNGDILRLILGKDDVDADPRGRVHALLSLEGGDFLDGKLENLGVFYYRGVRSLCLTWNGRSALGDGAGVSEPRGLTDFGKEVVRNMNALGMIADVSHASALVFWDALEISASPVIASHSNAYGVCPNRRNLNDAQLRAMGEAGGFVGLNMYPPFISGGETADEDMILRHIRHMLAAAGEDCVGLGCDFDGIDATPEGYGSAADLPKLYHRLVREFGGNLTDKIFYGNLKRVVKDVLR